MIKVEVARHCLQHVGESGRHLEKVWPFLRIIIPAVQHHCISTRSMQGMFGASVSELYLLIKSLLQIGRAVDPCVITKQKYTAYKGTVHQAWLTYCGHK